MYKICLIDDESGFKSTLEGYLDDIGEENGNQIDLVYIDPTNLDLDSLMELILDNKIDLILIDYKLVSYDGEDVISQLNFKNPFLPKAILTSNPEEFTSKYIDFRALDKKYVNIEMGAEFYNLMKKAILDYNEKKDKIQKEFDELYEKISSGDVKDNKKINRFMELDEELTKTYGLDSRINKGILDKTYLGELQEIIDLAKTIIKK